MTMADHTTDRFMVVLGPEDYADHILDMADVQLDEILEERKKWLLDEVLEERKERLPDEALEEFEELFSDEEFDDVLLSLGRTLPGEQMCSHGSTSYATGWVSFSEYAAEQSFGEIGFEGEAPEGMCSHCWSNTRKMLGEEVERDAEGMYDRIGSVGYRLRWKQKGRAREEWYDIVVRPETTMAELDRLVCRFSTLDDFHLRMYGLEDEYLDSSINVVPDQQHSANPANTRASNITIAEVAERANLWEGDRLSLVYDFGTPLHFYCIVKEIYEPAELDSLLTDNDLSAETETAAIVDQKRP
jgi:hypothetical protein